MINQCNGQLIRKGVQIAKNCLGTAKFLWGKTTNALYIFSTSQYHVSWSISIFISGSHIGLIDYRRTYALISVWKSVLPITNAQLAVSRHMKQHHAVIKAPKSHQGKVTELPKDYLWQPFMRVSLRTA